MRINSSYNIIQEALEFFPASEWPAIRSLLENWVYGELVFAHAEGYGAKCGLRGKLYATHLEYDGTCIRGVIRGEITTRCKSLTDIRPSETELRLLVQDTMFSGTFELKKKFLESSSYISTVIHKLTTLTGEPPYVIFSPPYVPVIEFEEWDAELVGAIMGTYYYSRIFTIEGAIK